MKRLEVDREQLSPMMKQYMEIKDSYEDCIVFFRLGDFYEMFFEDAIKISRELELTLTGKNAGLNERIPMCGVPHHSTAPYIEKLIENNYKVAICEQVEDASSDSKKIVKREVVEVISKGVSMSNDTISDTDNSYIGVVVYKNYKYYFSYLDITTGEFILVDYDFDTNYLLKTIINLGIKEIIVNTDKVLSDFNILTSQFNICVYKYDTINAELDYKYLYKDIKNENEIYTLNLLLSYINNLNKRNLVHLRLVEISNLNNYLLMDSTVVSNLELVYNSKLKNKSYTLLSILDKTKTASGSRLLKKYILNPLIDINMINKRLDEVTTLMDEFILLEELRTLLYNVYDIERICGKISYGNVTPKDLVALKNSISILPDITKILSLLKFDYKIPDLSYVYELIEKSIKEEPSLFIKEGNIIKLGYNELLDEYKDIRLNGKNYILDIENRERERTGIKTLKIGFNKIFGYYIEVTKSNIHLIKDEYEYDRKQTLAGVERYITPELKVKEEIILSSEDKINNLEYELFMDIRNELKNYIADIQEASKILSHIDVLSSFASISEILKYTRPLFNHDNIIDIKDGSHPVVSRVLNDNFVVNDIFMDNNIDILLITGPNMAGKSTYMRQLALISIMAQIGCFVPAKYANIKIFDKIFTRIGASDDLVSGESTFMVEMLEASNAIQNATKDSLILFDELGRGTATFDGVSIADSILVYLHNKVGAKTLFSTHYHELTSLEETLPKLKNIHVSALYENNKLTFLRKIKDGAISKSYGIQVAALAKMPNEIIDYAKILLDTYENSVNHIKPSMDVQVNNINENDNLIQKIKDININTLSPIDALNLVNELKMEVK